MDEQQNSNPQTPAAPTNRGAVMDIQPPQSGNAASYPTSSDTSSQENTGASNSSLATPPNDQMSVDSSISDNASATENQSPANDTNSEESQSPLMTAQQNQKNHSSTPQSVIIVAVVVAMVLVGLSVLAYMKGRDKHDAGHESTTQSQTDNKSGTDSPATTEDVDKTTSEIDKTIDQTNADKDFPASDVSDQTLGL